MAPCVLPVFPTNVKSSLSHRQTGSAWEPFELNRKSGGFFKIFYNVCKISGLHGGYMKNGVFWDVTPCGFVYLPNVRHRT
jgi:hypothetical protein